VPDVASAVLLLLPQSLTVEVEPRASSGERSGRLCSERLRVAAERLSQAMTRCQRHRDISGSSASLGVSLSPAIA
jgi:hypothetical protein